MEEKDQEHGSDYAIRRKWGRLVERGGFRGYQAVPDLLFRHQRQLGVTNTEMVVLLNILMHWWRVEDMPHPTVDTIARRMGTTTRSVQRALAGLKRKGLIADLKHDEAGDGRERYFRKFDVSLLVGALEFAEFGSVSGEHEPRKLFSPVPDGALSAPQAGASKK